MTMGARGGGVAKKAVMISCVSVIVTRWRMGKKIPKFCGRHLWKVPNAVMLLPEVHLTLQGDNSACSKPPIDIDLKVVL